jgi:hypothetical protein
MIEGLRWVKQIIQAEIALFVPIYVVHGHLLSNGDRD